MAFTYCTPPFCYTIAILIDEELTFYLVTSGGSYIGHGSLGAGFLTLETHYEYRSIGIDYHLQWEEVEELSPDRRRDYKSELYQKKFATNRYVVHPMCSNCDPGFR